ncbi:MAG: Rrf2 family transcriptional regulator, partial [Candidatus Bathyarchaeia archaeon]
NIFLKLKRAGLVRAVKGPRGGFLLTKDPKQITIGEIIRAMEGPVALVKCLLSVAACKKSGCCATRKLWQNLSYKFSELMDSITLADLIRGKKR